MFHKMQAISGLAEELLAFPQEWLVQGCGRLVGWLVGWWVGWLVSQLVSQLVHILVTINLI
jgi:hypothetical protein